MDFRNISYLEQFTFIKNQVFLRGGKLKLKTMFVFRELIHAFNLCLKQLKLKFLKQRETNSAIS
ncbi:hypothetical protein B0A80_15740 [Flavobacterium tructae]|nr:hypothetical protein B0A80_15740 [Flavobacterium tructae]